jgi:tetratricopeptide (TPR) repeat protein
MPIAISKGSKWPIPNLGLVSNINTNLMSIRGLIKNIGWRAEDQPIKPEAALDHLLAGRAFMYIVEDSRSASAYEIIRTITRHPAGRLTPILSLLTQPSASDGPAFQKILNTGSATLPLTVKDFMPAIKSLISTWQHPILMAVRTCTYRILNGEIDATIPALEQLSKLPAAAGYTAAALMQIHIKRENWKEAETTLLETTKMHPRNPSLLMSVADFYLQARMPEQSLRMFSKLRRICNNSTIYAADIAQCHLALGDVTSALQTLSEWHQVHPGNPTMTQFLARLYLAEGRELQLEKTLNTNRAEIKRLHDRWDKCENTGQATDIAS